MRHSTHKQTYDPQSHRQWGGLSSPIQDETSRPLPVFNYETDSPSSDGLNVFDRKPRQFFGFTGGAFHVSSPSALATPPPKSQI